MIRTAGYAAILILVLVKTAVERVADALPNNLAGSALTWTGEVIFLAVMACYAAVVLAYTAGGHRRFRPPLRIGTATGAAVGLMVYALGPLGFPLRFTGWWPARLYDAAMALGALLALCAPVAAGLVADPAVERLDARCVPASGRAPWPDCAPGRPPRWWSPSCPRPRSRCCPTTPGCGTGPQAISASGRRSSARWRRSGPHSCIGYMAGNSAFAAGYLIVLLLSPLAGCILGAWAGWVAGSPGHSRPQRPRSAQAPSAGSSSSS